MERVIDIRMMQSSCRFVGVEVDDPVIVIHGGITICRGCSSLLKLQTPIRGIYKGHLADMMGNWEDEVMYLEFMGCSVCGEKLMSMRIVCGKGFTADGLFQSSKAYAVNDRESTWS